MEKVPIAWFAFIKHYKPNACRDKQVTQARGRAPLMRAVTPQPQQLSPYRNARTLSPHLSVFQEKLEI